MQKKLFLIIEILTTALLLSFAVLLFFPAYRVAVDEITAVKERCISLLQEKTGLVVSCGSVSPSILKRASLKNVEIVDSFSGTKLCSIRKISVYYNPFSFLTDEPLSAITRINIEDGSVSADVQMHEELFKKLSTLFSADSDDDTKNNKNAKSINSLFGLVDVTIKNLSITYSNASNRVSAELRKVLFSVSSDTITFNFDGSTVFSGDSLSASSDITIAGIIDSSFSSGSAQISLSDNRFPRFSISDLSFLLVFSGNTVELHSVETVKPFDITALFDFNAMKANLSISAAKFNLLSAVTTDADFLTQFKNAEFTGIASATADFSNGFLYTYAADFSFLVPSLYRHTEDCLFSLRANGNPDRIDIQNLSVTSTSLQIDFDGLFVYESPERNTVRSQSVFPFFAQGKLIVSKCILPSGANASAQFFFNPYRDGLLFLSPSLTIGSITYSDMELTVIPSSKSVDFAFSLQQYADSGATDDTATLVGLDGNITADGSILFDGSPYLQLFAGIDSLLLDPAYRMAILATADLTSSPSDMFVDYALTTELYISSDFSHISFNCPRLVLASVSDDRMYALFSAVGSERNIDFSDISVIFNGNSFSGDVHAEIGIDDGILFSSAVAFNDIPYSLSGFYMNDGEFSLFGDYGFSAAGTINSDFSKVNGHMLFTDLPISLSPVVLSLSLDSSFAYAKGDSWNINLHSLDVAELSGVLAASPRIHISGILEDTGIFFDSLTYADNLSVLQGVCSLNWNFQETTRFIESQLSLASDSGESVQCNIMLSNSSPTDFFDRKELYFSMQTTITNLSFGHVFENQQQDHVLSLFAVASGNSENVLFNLECPGFSFVRDELPVSGHFTATAADNVISIQNTAFSTGAHAFSNFTLEYTVADALLSLDTDYAGIIADNGIVASVNLALTGITDPSQSILDSVEDLFGNFTADIQLSNIVLNGEKHDGDLPLMVLRLPNQLVFSAGAESWLQGSISSDGNLVVDAKSPFPADFSLNGNFLKDFFEVRLTNAKIDLPRVWQFMQIPTLVFDTGVVYGDLTITGSLSDPEFSGSFIADDISLRIPDFVAETFGPFSIPITANGNTVSIAPTDIKSASGMVNLAVSVLFDRWNLDDVLVNVKTVDGTRIQADMQLYMVHVKGEAAADLDIKVNSSRLFLGGDLLLDRGFICMSNDFSSLNETSENHYFSFNSDFSVSLGSHVEFLFPSERMPIIRASMAASQPVAILTDGTQKTFSVNGAADIKSGQIFYVKRNFYLRNGRIAINANQDLFDPLVSFHAEIRERDTENNMIRIILSADNQFLSRFLPVLSSSPAKSEAEIRTLLGQAAFVDVVSGDSSDTVSVKELALSVSDVFMQFFFIRQFEDFMRDSLHLDSFSIRTQLIQNAINNATVSNQLEANKQRIGNYFDNTSVYLGKYMGSNIYLDGMFHLYYDKTSLPNDPWGGLRVQLETGFEIASPFCNIRYNFSPKLEDLSKTLGIPDSSVTLSWKFNF